MHSSLIGKIQKAHVYAEEPERLSVQGFSARFRGDHDSYLVSFGAGQWKCSCRFFPQWGVSSHVMATQRMLDVIAPRETADLTPAVAS